MKLLALLSSGAILVVAIAQQEPTTTFPEPLAGDFSKLAQAKTLTVHFKKRIIGEPAKEYTLAMAKDKKFKLTYDEGFVLSDGNNLYVYKKADNSYTKSNLTAQDLTKFQKRVEIFGWEAFMQGRPGSDLASVAVGANRTVQGEDLQTVDVTVRPDNHSATLLINPKLGVTQGFTIKLGDKEYLVLADSVHISTDPAPDRDFAFIAPEGATLAKTAEEGSFALVQSLMNDNCMPCHSAERKRAGVDVSNYDGIVATVIPGQSSASLLVKALKGDGVDLMPKGHAPFTSEQIASVSKWIDAGAKNQ